MGIPALTTEQMVEVDRIMIEEYGIQLMQMMENAGRNLAEQAIRMMGGSAEGKKVAALCGKGNNGGGGMVAARHLHNRGAGVTVHLAGDPSDLKEIPGIQWQILERMGVNRATAQAIEEADLIIDALIGYGLQGNPRGPAAAWIRRANASPVSVLSLDAPSGLDTTEGVPGEPCIVARATMTLALPKVGLLTAQAHPVVGRLYCADISVPPELYRRLGLVVGPLFKTDTIIEV